MPVARRQVAMYQRLIYGPQPVSYLYKIGWKSLASHWTGWRGFHRHRLDHIFARRWKLFDICYEAISPAPPQSRHRPAPAQRDDRQDKKLRIGPNTLRPSQP